MLCGRRRHDGHDGQDGARREPRDQESMNVSQTRPSATPTAGKQLAAGWQGSHQGENGAPSGREGPQLIAPYFILQYRCFHLDYTLQRNTRIVK